MTAGELRDLVVWFRPVRTRKDGGQEARTYLPVHPPLSAKVEQAAGTEQDAHDQPVMIRLYVVTVRDKPHDVGQDWLGVWNGLTLNVKGQRREHDSGDDWLMLDCVELAAATT